MNEGARGLTRRQLLGKGGLAVAGLGGLAAAGLAGYAWPRTEAAASTTGGSATGGSATGGSTTGGAADGAPATATVPGDATAVLNFVSRSDLTPPAVTIVHRRRTSTPRAEDPPFFLVAASGYPHTGPGEPGLMILNRNGGLVWYSPNTGFPASQGKARADFNIQSYRGKPVLTWWEGQMLTGYGQGRAVIADSSYRTVATVSAGNGLAADLHEFVITPQDTALITAYRPVTTDLSRLGGPAKGMALSGVVQEIDIPSGRVLFEWSSLDYIPVTDTYSPFTGATSAAPFDYLHINSVAIAPDGDLLISARHTCAVYKVARPSGKIVWQLGGKRSSFRMGAGATFWFQHHVRPHGPDMVSIFDDGGAPPVKEPQSRAILLNLDTGAMRATLKRSYVHPAGLAAANQGSMQMLADGRVLVGWGNLPYFSEFAGDGTLLLDGQFPVGDQSYRAFTGDWTGHPAEAPALAARVNPAGGSIVYASWNGATELDSWTVLAGSTAASLAQVGSQEHSGFETAVTVSSAGPYFAVTAHDADGRVLGRSPAVTLGK